MLLLLGDDDFAKDAGDGAYAALADEEYDADWRLLPVFIAFTATCSAMMDYGASSANAARARVEASRCRDVTSFQLSPPNSAMRALNAVARHTFTIATQGGNSLHSPRCYRCHAECRSRPAAVLVTVLPR